MPVQTEEQQVTSNLMTEKGEVPLRGVKIEGDIKGHFSKVTVIQRYENTEKVDLEAVYTFPLEEGSAVCGFEAKVGDKIIKGEVKEREEAFEAYDDAMSEGHGAFLLDQERPNIFTASVGNLKPGAEVEVSVSYVTPLPYEGNALRFSIPTTISPRFVPYEATAVGQPDSERVNPPAQQSVPYGFSAKLSFELGSDIEEITSPSHKLKVEKEGTTATVTLEKEEEAMDREFVVLVECKDPHKPFAAVGREEDGTRVAMVTMFPDPELTDKSGREIIFVLDCSGSMMGTSIREAREAIKLCIRSLSEGDSFNVIRFGSRMESWAEKPVEYGEVALNTIMDWLDRVDANLGGTMVYEPLELAVTGPGDPEKPRSVVLLTDGQVSNEDDVIALCKEHNDRVRVFSFGIGAGYSDYMIKGIARAGRGAAEFIYPGERIEPKVLRMFKRIATPTFPSVDVDWGDLIVKTAPLETPPLFFGDSFLLCGRVQEGSTETVTLKAGDHEWSVPLNLEEPTGGDVVPLIWAKHMIQDLEDGRRARRGSQQSERQSKLREKKLIDMGVKYGLSTSMTSFVAIEYRKDADKSKGAAELRRVPIAITQGWHGGLQLDNNVLRSFAGGMSAGSAAAAYSCDSVTIVESTSSRGIPINTLGQRSAKKGRSRKKKRLAGGQSFPGAQMRSMITKSRTDVEVKTSGGSVVTSSNVSVTGGDYYKGGSASWDTPTETRGIGFGDEVPELVTDRDNLYALLHVQYGSGCFELSPQLSAVIGIERMQRLTKLVEESPKGRERVLVTMYVIEYLKLHMNEYHDEWELAMDKARKFLHGAEPYDVSAAL